MSGLYRRNIASSGKGNLNRNLPALLNDFEEESPKKKIIDRLFYKQTYSANDSCNSRTSNIFSSISSAQSRRFNDIFYRNDWPSLSDAETCDSPDCLESEDSDSSASSVISWADLEGTKRVCEEWEKIQRTLYDEDGPKVTQPHLIEECQQWKTIFPHLRVVGRGFTLKDPNDDLTHEAEEVLAWNYESDVNYYNNQGYRQDFIKPIENDGVICDTGSKISSASNKSATHETELMENLNEILHISPVCYNSPFKKKTKRGKAPNIFKSEVSASKWRQRNSDSPVFITLPHQNTNDSMRETSASSGNMWSGVKNNNVTVEKHKSSTDKIHFLEPIEINVKKNVSRDTANNIRSGTAINRNIALPPIHSNETKRQAILSSGNSLSGKVYKQNKKILSPLNKTSAIVPKHNIKIDADALSVFENRSAVQKYKKNKKK